MDIRIRVDGTKKLRADLERLRLRVPANLANKVTRELATFGVRYARANQGFRNITWKAHKSIGVEQSRQRSGRFKTQYSLVFGNKRAYYARYLEFGTYRIRPRRTLERTLIHLKQFGMSRSRQLARQELRQQIRRATEPSRPVVLDPFQRPTFN